MQSPSFHTCNEATARAFAKRLAERFSAKATRFPKAASSLNALYRIRATANGMALHIFVGDRTQTVWVQNFELHDPFLNLAFAVNEPDRAAALVYQAEVGLSLPVFLNSQLYCGPELVRDFCKVNAVDIGALQLAPGERFSVQRKQLRLKLITDDVERVVLSLAPVTRLFHRTASK